MELRRKVFQVLDKLLILPLNDILVSGKPLVHRSMEKS